jgi:hypothetical protein
VSDLILFALILWLGFNFAVAFLVVQVSPRIPTRAMEAVRTGMRRACRVWAILPIVWIAGFGALAPRYRIAHGAWPEVERNADSGGETARAGLWPEEFEIHVVTLWILAIVVFATPLLAAWAIGWSCGGRERARLWTILGLGLVAIVAVLWLDPWGMARWIVLPKPSSR